MRISDRVAIQIHGDLMDIGGTDIHAGVAAAGWLDMSLFDKIAFYVAVGPTATETWNAADQLDTLHINQANTAVGGATKALVPAVNLDQVAANTAGETFVLECTAAHCDTVGGFHWVRLEASEAGDTGADYCVVGAILYGARYQHDDMSGATDTA